MATKTATAAAEAPTQAKPRMVKIKLFKDNYKYKDDVFVAIGGRRWVIKRGVEVEVPYYVAKVLKQSIEQDNKTANMIEELEREALEASKHY